MRNSPLRIKAQKDGQMRQKDPSGDLHREPKLRYCRHSLTLTGSMTLSVFHSNGWSIALQRSHYDE